MSTRQCRVLMIQGTGSDVGKSTVVAGLCRIARRRGLSVAPFKPQNMSNNAAVTPDGGEIGRAQALQAQAAGIAPSVHMNPVLLKPETDCRAQVVVQGRALGARQARDYMAGRHRLLEPVLASFSKLTAAHDLVFVEGAGSPAEVNLRKRDIANMGFALPAGVPVCLLADIDRGGVIASLAGTREVLDRRDAAQIRAFAINRFRGDPRLFDAGLEFIERRTGWESCGVIPWLPVVRQLPAEDAVVLDTPPSGTRGNRPLRIVAPMLSRIANFDDADPLRHEPGVDFRFVPPGEALPRDADMVILFGSKSTRADTEFLVQQGWHHDLHAHVRTGGRVLGLCGGFQILGRWIDDPEGYDGISGRTPGLGLLAIDTCMSGKKTVQQVSGHCVLSGARIRGYEIHHGRSRGDDLRRPMLTLQTAEGILVPDGARSADGRVEGCYVHGLFNDTAFRHTWLARISDGRIAPRVGSTMGDHDSTVDRALDKLADALERALDIDRLLALAETPGWRPALPPPDAG